MLKYKSLRFLLPTILSIILVMGGFSCNILTGPHHGGGADTTSNNFTFQSYTFGAGNAGSSYLQDIAIINDSDIWAVGAVYLDSADGNPDPFPYNAVHWDGSGWQPMKITVQTRYGLVTAPFYGVYAFSSNDIWISSGLPIHGDGKSWTQYDLYGMGILSQTDGYVTRIFGENSTNIYFVGTKGTIVHNSNGTWTKISSGTTLNIDDIWGDGGQILAIASNVLSFPQDRKVLQVNGNTATAISDSGLPLNCSSIWFVSGQKYFVVGEGIHFKHVLNENIWSGYPSGVVTSYYSESVRGIDTSSVVVAGDFGEIAYYNGKRWSRYWSSIPYSNGSFHSVSIKENMMVAVGELNNAAWIVVGKR